MICSYTFYETDESFDYGDWGLGCHTHYVIAPHGFDIDVDKDDNVDINTLDAYGDYIEMNEIKTLAELKKYIEAHIHEVQEDNNRECLEELVDFITCQIAREV